MNINLTTSSQEEEILKAYLEENASATLADKINHGVFIEQDGKRLLNKKSLSSFMEYAAKEAQNVSAKGARSACIKDETVFGWAMHYFEEDSIIGTLYNEDGSEYKKPVPQPKTSGKSTYTPTSVKKQEPQLSLFDMMSGEHSKAQAVETVQEVETDETEPIEEEVPQDGKDDSPTEEDLDEAFDNVITPKEPKAVEKQTEQKGSPFYEKYKEIALKYPDSIVCYRLGDFYEVIGKKATVAADELELTLTGRDCGLTERIPMVGFPYHCADMYFSKLVNKGYKIAIVEHSGEIFQKPEKKTKAEPEIDVETGEILDGDKSDEELMKNYHKGALLALLELFDDQVTIG